MYKFYSKDRPGWVMWLIAGALIALLLIIAIVYYGRNYYLTNLKPVSKSQTAITITIPNGATLHEIATILKTNGLIRNTRVFEQYVRNQNKQDKLQAGTYSISPSEDVETIVDLLSKGHIVKNLFTILPGQRIDQIKSAMINAGFDATDVEKAFDPSLYADHPALAGKPANASLEGYLYPESFQKIATTKPETIIRQSLDEMQKRLTPEMQAAFVRHGLTTHQAITLASVVEREVSNPDDRKTVAQVFYSRLQQGRRLESDVTAFYGAIVAGKAPSVNYDSPYNTYLHDGLPVGPISNVSLVSLDAVANPSTTDWMYFVAGDDGKTYYSHTLEEHEALVKQHCKKLCGQ